MRQREQSDATLDATLGHSLGPGAPREVGFIEKIFSSSVTICDAES